MNDENRKRKWGLILLVSSFILHPSSLRAPQTATVTPGYVYATNERPTTSTLNRLGSPTVTLSGYADIAAGSINGAHLASTFAGSNLTWDGSSPRRLVIANGSIGTLQLASNAVLNGRVHFTGNATVTGTNTWGIFDLATGQYLLSLTPGGGVSVGEPGLDLYLNANIVRIPGGLSVGPGSVSQQQGGSADTNAATLSFTTYAHTTGFTNQFAWQLNKGFDSDGSPFTLQHYYGTANYVSNRTTAMTWYTNDSVAVAGGVIHNELATFPTNAIPPSSLSGTNWAQFTYRGYLRTIATNYGASGSFLKLVGETISAFVP